MAREMTGEEIFCLQGCRDYPQYYKMRKGFEEGRCPFCELDRELNKVLYEDGSWRLWENPFPRKTLGIQLVIVPKAHVRWFADLAPSAWRDLQTVFEWIEGAEGRYTLGNQGGMFFARFGDMRYNAGTVPHLHLNYWVPTGTGEVDIPVFKSVESRHGNEQRAAGFAERYENGEVSD